MVRIFGIPVYCSDENRWSLFGRGSGSDDVVQEVEPEESSSKEIRKERPPVEKVPEISKEQTEEPAKDQQIQEEVPVEEIQDVFDLPVDEEVWKEMEQPKPEEKEEEQGVFEKVRRFFEKKKRQFQKFLRKIKGLFRRLSDLKGLFEDQELRGAVSRVKDYGIQGGKLLLPQKVRGSVTFGFDDPALTGQVLGGLAILFPVYGEALAIQPDFTETTLKGWLKIKGRLRRYALLRLAWTIWQDKDLMRQKDRVVEMIGG
jgi:hypothetical protein